MSGGGRQLAGTTLRFVLLLTLLLVASVWMTQFTLTALGFLRPTTVVCVGAVATDALRPDLSRGPELASYDPVRDCVERQGVTPPWWVIPAASLLVLGAAAVLFAVLPHWKARRSRVLPLTAVDPDGQVGRLVAELIAQTGLRRAPTVLVDPTALSAGAVVFGRNGRPRLCLHGGLLARQRTDPQAVRAVLLHELGHIDNRDVTLTYATVTLWRSFIVVVLAPFVVAHLYLYTEWPDSVAPQRNLLAAALMVALVYLSRSDLLRTREFHADLAAARWGADLRAWSAASPVRAGRRRRLLTRFGRLWRIHPDWESRRQVLADPGVLSRIPALAMFLTGATLILVDAQLWMLRAPLTASTVAVALLATGVISTLVWQAAEPDRRAGRAGTRGLRAGLWLGLGMLAAELVSNRVAIVEWLPRQPLLLVLLVLAGVTITWWITQCCHLWASAWPGRSLRPVRWIVFVVGLVAVVGWLTWWRSAGVILAHGMPRSLSQMAQLLAPAGLEPGQLLSYEAVLPVYVVFGWLTSSLTLESVPLSQIAVAVSWAIPLAAWLIRPRPETEVVEAPTPASSLRPVQLPRLRQLVLPALAGSLLGWAAVVTTMAVMQSALPVTGLRARIFVHAYQGWITIALLSAAVLSAFVASALAGRHQLVAAVTAGQLTVLGGAAGVLALVAVDGCIRPLTLFHTSCGWHPGQAWAAWHWLLGWILASALIAAVPAAGLVAAVRAVTDRWRRDRPAAAVDVPGRARMVVRWAFVALVVPVALTLAVAREVGSAGGESVAGESVAGESAAEEAAALPGPSGSAAPTGSPSSPDSPRLKAVQLSAWLNRGGSILIARFADVNAKLAVAVSDHSVRKPKANGRVDIDESRFRPLCASIGTIAEDAARYAAVPDTQAQASWRAFAEHAARAGRDCPRSFDTEDSELFLASLAELRLAATHLTATAQRINDLRKAGGG